MFLRETEQKSPGLNLMHDKYKPVIYPLDSELFTWTNRKKAFSKTKACGLRQPHNGWWPNKIKYVRNNKVDRISEIWLPQKRHM